MKENPRFMSIGEIAKAIGITRRIILHYEEFGLLKPDIKDGTTGNRYYTADSLTRIRSIRVLQNLGLSLEEIAAYFDDEANLAPIIDRLEILRDELNLSIEKLRARMDASEKPAIFYARIPQQTIYCRTYAAETIAARKEHLRDIIPAAMRQYGSDTSKRMYFIEYALAEPNTISYCIAIPEDSTGTYVRHLPEVSALVTTYHGAYENISAAKDLLVSYANAHAIALQGVCRHIYLEGPPQHKDSNKFITQIALLLPDSTASNKNLPLL